jgi:hypothetical protein
VNDLMIAGLGSHGAFRFLVDPVTDRWGTQGGLLLVLGFLLYAVLMNVWHWRVIKGTAPGTAARKRGVTRYAIGAVVTFNGAILALVLFLRGWGPEVRGLLEPMLFAAAMIFYVVRGIKVSR